MIYKRRRLGKHPLFPFRWIALVTFNANNNQHKKKSNELGLLDVAKLRLSGPSRDLFIPYNVCLENIALHLF